MYKIYAANKSYTGILAGVPFVQGVGTTDNAKLAEYYKGQGARGFTVEACQSPAELEASAAQAKEAEATRQLLEQQLREKEEQLQRLQAEAAAREQQDAQEDQEPTQSSQEPQGAQEHQQSPQEAQQQQAKPGAAPGPTAEELRAKAKELGIAGAASMNKAQLMAAIHAANMKHAGAAE